MGSGLSIFNNINHLSTFQPLENTLKRNFYPLKSPLSNFPKKFRRSHFKDDLINNHKYEDFTQATSLT